MPEIHITALRTIGIGGPSVPCMHSAFMSEITIAGSQHPCLKMMIGDCTISVWPAYTEAIQALGDDLVSIAGKLAGKE